MNQTIKYVCGFILLSLLIPLSANSQCSSGYAGISIIDNPDYMEVCGDADTFEIKITNTSITDTLASGELTPGLPTGITIVDLVSSVPAGVIYLSSTGKFYYPDILPAGTFTIKFRAKANCDIISDLLDSTLVISNSYRFEYDVSGTAECDYTSGSSDPYTSAVTSPTFNFLSIVPAGPKGNPGDTILQTLTLSQDDFKSRPDSVWFEMIKGTGLTLAGLTVNGKAASFTTSGSTVSVLLTDSLLGSDGVFTESERLVVKVYWILDDCDYLNTGVEYGLFISCSPSTSCSDSRASKKVTIFPANGDPAVTYRYQTLQDATTCDTGILRIFIINTGTESHPLAGAMKDIVLRTGYPGTTYNNLQPYCGGLATSIEYRVSGNVATWINGPGCIDSIRLDQFTTDPDGAGRGLEDLDGDGYYNDLAIGDTFYLDWYMQVKDGRFWITCTSQTFNYRALVTDYKDQCDSAYYPRSAPHGVYKANYASGTYSTGPLDVPSGDTISVGICVALRLHKYSGIPVYDCPNDTLELIIDLDTMWSVPSSCVVTFDNPSHLPASSIISSTVVGDSLVVRFVPTGEYVYGCFEFCLVYDCPPDPCTSPPLPPVVDWKIVENCDPDCGIREIRACGTWTGRLKGCGCGGSGPGGLPGPPAPGDTDCIGTDGCIATMDARVKRVNYGYTDGNETTKVTATTSGVATTHFLGCDTMNILSPGYVAGDICFEDFVIDVRFTNSVTVTSPELIFADGEIIIYDGGTPTAYNITSAPVLTDLGGTPKSWNYRFTRSSIPAYIDTVLEHGDSVILNANFVVNDTGMGNTFYDNKSLYVFHYGYDSLTDTTYGCLDGRAQWRVIRYNNYVYAPDRRVDACGIFYGWASSLGFGGVVACAYPGDPFPNEFRRVSRIDSMVVKLPPGYDLSSGFSLRIIGYGEGIAGTYTVTPTYSSGDTLFIFDGKSWPAEDIYNSISGSIYYPRLNARFSTDCETQTGDYFVEIQRDRYPETCIRKEWSRTSANVWYNDVSLEVTPLNRVNVPTGDSAYFDFQICNLSSIAMWAQNIFAATEHSGTRIRVNRAVRLSNPSVNLLKKSYGVEKFIFEVGDLWWGAGSCDTIRIYYGTQGCEDDSLNVFFGTNCDVPGYPDTLSKFPCNLLNEVVYNQPQLAELKIEVLDEPDSAVEICDTLEYTIAIKNVRLGTAENLRIDVIVPKGSKMADRVMYTKFPGSASVWRLTPGPFYSHTDTAGRHHEVLTYFVNPYLFYKGLPGASIGADSNKILIKFKVALDCDFRSGDRIGFTARGMSQCGKPALGGYRVDTKPIKIIGAEPGYNTRVELDVDTTKHCQVVTPLHVNIVNLGTGYTSIEDSINLLLPPGYYYQSLIKIHNAASMTTAPGKYTTSGGGLNLAWNMPDSIRPGDSVTFTVNLVIDFYSTCGPNPLRAITQQNRNLICTSTMDTCLSVAITGDSTIDHVIDKSRFSISVIDHKVHRDSTTLRWVSKKTITITNTGIDFPAGDSVLLDIWCDDGDGILDAGDTWLGQIVVYGPIPGFGGTKTITTTTKFPFADCPDPLAGMLFSLGPDSTFHQCMCDSAEIYDEPTLPVDLLNFDGIAEDSRNKLFWEVIVYPGTWYFDIERLDPVTQWNLISRVSSNDPSAEPQYYHTYDENPPTKGYYRLKTVDYDGQFSYSPIVYIERDDINKVSIYPNPTSGKVTIESAGPYEYVVFNGIGEIVLSGEQLENRDILELDLSKFAAGVYHVQITKNGVEVHEKVVVSSE